MESLDFLWDLWDLLRLFFDPIEVAETSVLDPIEFSDRIDRWDYSLVRSSFDILARLRGTPYPTLALSSLFSCLSSLIWHMISLKFFDK